MPELQVKKLERIVERVCVGFVGSCNKDYTEQGNGVPMVRTTNLTGTNIDYVNMKYISYDFHKKNVKSQLKRGDILVARHGENGLPSIYEAEEEANCLNVVLVKPHLNANFVDNYYLLYALKSPFVVHQIKSAVGGSVQGVVNTKVIAELEVPYPERKTREIIVSHLSNIDKKIELNHQTNQTLEHIAQAIFKSWFVDFEPTRAKIVAKQNDQDPERAAMAALSGKTLEQLDQLSPEQQQQLKSTAALFPDTLVDSALGEVPEGWDVKPLEDIAENHSTTFDFSKVDQVVFVNTGDVLEGRFLHKNYSNKEGLPGQAKKTIKKDDILYSEIRPKNKRFAYVVADCDDYVVSTKFMIVRSLGFVHPRYLYQILRQETTIREFNLIAESRSGTFPQITFDSIGYMPVVVPPEDVQATFMIFFTPIIEKIDMVMSENTSLIELRNSLLPKLLSGDLNIDQPLKEVANG